MSEGYFEHEDERIFDTGLINKVFTLSMGNYKYNEENKELLFLDRLASFLDEGWRIKPLEIFGGRIRVYNPEFIGFSESRNRKN